MLFYADIHPILAQAPTTAKIAFMTARNGNRDVYLMNPDGSKMERITRHRAMDVGPKWSPTGEQILFESDRDRFPLSWDLYLMDADGSNVRRIFAKSVDRRSAEWSPDGERIAYTRWEQGKTFIYIAPIDGKKEERMVIGSQPSWSPDGTEIAFIEGGPRDPKRISILNVKTGKHKFFFPPKAPDWVRHVAWAPAGDKFAFSWNKVPGNFDTETIYIVNRDGTGVRQVINKDVGRAVEPSWSPAADALLYHALDKNRDLQMFKVSLADGVPIQLTPPGFWHYVGDWFDPAFALPVSPQPHLLATTWSRMKKNTSPE
jgi:Tol biopolymer transport system component